jgi:hypothetical protein
MLSPENQKECSARRAKTNGIIKYSVKNNGFAIPAIA